jgi:hypothetical protein
VSRDATTAFIPPLPCRFDAVLSSRLLVAPGGEVIAKGNHGFGAMDEVGGKFNADHVHASHLLPPPPLPVCPQEAQPARISKVSHVPHLLSASQLPTEHDRDNLKLSQYEFSTKRPFGMSKLAPLGAQLSVA